MKVLSRSAVVEIQLINADTIVLKRTLQSKFSFWTNTGGLMSLFMGVSVLTFGEVLVWVVHSIVVKCTILWWKAKAIL